MSHDGISSRVQPPAFTGKFLFRFKPTTEEQLRKVILKSKPASSSVDPIPTKIALDCLEILLPVILNIINESLICGIVPKPLKCAVTKPPLKKPGLDPNLPKHYRLVVPNLPYVSKLLERVDAAHLMELLAEHNFLDRFQSAYRPGHCTETAVLRVLNDILCSANGRHLVPLMLLGLSAAFHTIDHSLLLQRLYNEDGVIGSVNRWSGLILQTDRSMLQYICHPLRLRS